MDNPGPGPIVSGMKHDSDILIAGGGLNGPVLALALARAGLSVTLVDAAGPTKGDAFGGTQKTADDFFAALRHEGLTVTEDGVLFRGFAGGF